MSRAVNAEGAAADVSDSAYGTPFVGRERERAAIAARLADTAAGRGGVVLIAGEPGIGKTRLAEEAAIAAAAAGWRAHWGRCYEGDGAPAFWPWTQILRSYLPAAASGDGGDAAEIALLVPEAGAHVSTSRRASTTVTAQERLRTFESVTRMLTHDRRRSLLIIDDLQWADASSLLLFQFFAREIRETAAVVIATYRDSEGLVGHPFRGTLAEMARLPHVSRIRLDGLNDAEVAQLVSAMVGRSEEEGAAYSAAQRGAGNPFFIGELVRLAMTARETRAGPFGSSGRMTDWEPEPADVPAGVRDVLARRLERLTEACRQVLSAAAVIGQEFTFGILRQVAGLRAEIALDALDEAADAHLIRVAPGAQGRYSFIHTLVREVLYLNLPASRRIRMHHAVAEALREHHEPAPESHLAEIAHHYFKSAAGGDAGMAVWYCRLAGEYALAHLGYEEAAGHFERAIQALDAQVARDASLRGELYLALGDARMRAGETAAAQEAYLEAAAIGRGLSAVEDGASKGDAAPLLGRAALGFGRGGIETGLVNMRLVGLIEPALAIQGATDSDLRVRLLGRLAMELYYSDQRERRAALSGEALAMARRLDRPDALAFALHARHFTLWEPENLEERLALGAELPGAAEAAGDPEMQLQGYLLAVPDLLEVGQVGGARRSIESFVRLAGELRQPLYLWHAARLRTLCAYFDGDLEAMERLADEALAIAVRAGINGADVLHVSHIQFLRREQGRYDEVEGPILEIVSRYPRLAESWRLALANVYAQTGRAGEARRELGALTGSGVAAAGRGLFTIAVMALLTEAVVAIEDGERAAELYGRLLPYAGRCIVNGATPNFYGPASYYLGCLAGTLDRADAAIEHLQRALAMNRRLGIRPLIARNELALASALRGRGGRADRERAAVLAERARGTAVALGMSQVASDAVTLVAQTANYPVAQAVAGGVAVPFGALTSRQLEVLRLLASGKSNREIAEALTVSVNTVERHLVTIYDRLGVQSRSAATAFAHRHGLN